MKELYDYLIECCLNKVFIMDELEIIILRKLRNYGHCELYNSYYKYEFINGTIILRNYYFYPFIRIKTKNVKEDYLKVLKIEYIDIKKEQD